MSIYFWRTRRGQIQFITFKVGGTRQVAEVKLKLPEKMSGTIHCGLGWENGYLRMAGEDKARLIHSYGISDSKAASLEKLIYWGYTGLVRQYLYESLDACAYTEIFQKNLLYLRQSSCLTMEEAAHNAGVATDTLAAYEAGSAYLREDLRICKTESILFKMAKVYSVPSSELISQSLFYHVPIPGLPVDIQRQNTVIEKYGKIILVSKSKKRVFFGRKSVVK